MIEIEISYQHDSEGLGAWGRWNWLWVGWGAMSRWLAVIVLWRWCARLPWITYACGSCPEEAIPLVCVLFKDRRLRHGDWRNWRETSFESLPSTYSPSPWTVAAYSNPSVARVLWPSTTCQILFIRLSSKLPHSATAVSPGPCPVPLPAPALFFFTPGRPVNPAWGSAGKTSHLWRRPPRLLRRLQTTAVVYA